MRGEKKFGGMYDGGVSIPQAGGVEEPVVGGGVEEPVAGAGEEEAGAFAIPEEYAEKGYSKDIKSEADLWKKLDGSQSLLGKRPADGIQLPGENATPEELASFYGSLGRPDDAGKYEFNREGQPEGMAAFNSEEMDSAAKAIFHKWGLRPDQATGIQTDYEALLGETYSDQVGTQKKLDSDFEDLTTKTFGNDKEVILENAKALLTKHAPEGFEEYIRDLPNEALTVMAGVLNDIKSKYISEDAFEAIKGNSGGGNSVDELRKQGQELMLSKEYTDPFNPRHDQRKAEVAEVYARIAQMGQQTG